MAHTIQNKLSRLIETKANMRTKFSVLGVEVPPETPFRLYPDYFDQLGHVPPTTEEEDLFDILDLYHFLGTNKYVDHTYTAEEIQAVFDLLNTIVEGER